MNLMLSAVTHNDHRLTRPITAVFDAAGGTVGRADHCTLALPDPERFISRKQAEVVAVTGGMFLIRNVGSANPIVIGQRSLAMNESAVLQHGDVIRIAGYELQASYTAQTPAPTTVTLQRSPAMPGETPPPVSRPQAAFAEPVAANPFADLLSPDAAAPAEAPPPAARPQAVFPASNGANPFADLLSPGTTAPVGPSGPSLAHELGLGGANPFADLLGSAPRSTTASEPLDSFKPAPAPDLVPAAAGLSPASWEAPAASANPFPDDFDPFQLPAVNSPAAERATDPFGLVQPDRPQSIDQQFGLPADGAGPDPLADFLRPASADVFADARFSQPPADDVLAALSPPAPATDLFDGLADGGLSPIHDAFEPPRLAVEALAPVAAQETRVAPRSAQAPTPDVAALWMAFCRGAEIQIAAPADEAQLAHRLEHVGRILKAAVAGTQELMAVRASTKYEMRAQVTQIQARSNNPLKFAPDVRTGVEQLVEPAARGFLEGPAAMEDAMKDLIGHMIGSVAGMRAALEGLLDRFTPEMLEKTLGQGSVLESLVPMGRKARLWELYLLRYQTLRESAQDDFHTVFGKAFLAAYEQQVERLKKKGARP